MSDATEIDGGPLNRASNIAEKAIEHSDAQMTIYNQTVDACVKSASCAELVRYYISCGKNAPIIDKVQEYLITRQKEISADDVTYKLLVNFLFEGFQGESTRLAMAKRAFFVKLSDGMKREDVQYAVDYLAMSKKSYDRNNALKLCRQVWPRSREYIDGLGVNEETVRIAIDLYPEFINDNIHEIIRTDTVHNPTKLRCYQSVNGNEVVNLPALLSEDFVTPIWLMAKSGETLAEKLITECIPPKMTSKQMGILIWALGEFGYLRLIARLFQDADIFIDERESSL